MLTLLGVNDEEEANRGSNLLFLLSTFLHYSGIHGKESIFILQVYINTNIIL